MWKLLFIPLLGWSNFFFLLEQGLLYSRLASNSAKNSLEFWHFYLYFPSIGITSVYHRTQFIPCWGLSP